MTYDIDAEALVAHLTKTSPDQWQRVDREPDEIHLVETGDDLGPSEEDVASMIREGYTNGIGWALTTEIDLEEDEAACEVIARLVSEDFTSGIDPTWSISIDNREPRVALVLVDEDGDVTATIGTDVSATHQVHFSTFGLVQFAGTIDEMREDPDLARFVKDPSPVAAPPAPSP